MRGERRWCRVGANQPVDEVEEELLVDADEGGAGVRDGTGGAGGAVWWEGGGKGRWRSMV